MPAIPGLAFAQFNIFDKYPYLVYYFNKELSLEIYSVIISKKAYKDLQKVPKHVVLELQAWVESVDIVEVTKHDYKSKS